VAGSQDVQHAVEQLATTLGLPVLVEDDHFQPLWWSAQDAVDGHRLRSILQRTIHPAAVAMVRRLKLARATGPVRTPAVPEAELMPRWCVPVRRGSTLFGYLWVLDVDGVLAADDLEPASACAVLATAYLAQTSERADQVEHRLAELLQRLTAGADTEAVYELVDLQRLDPDPQVIVQAPAQPGGWSVGVDLSAHIVAATHPGGTSGAPLPLAELSVAVRRASATRQVLRTGARLDPPSWAGLGSWHLIIAAAAELRPRDIHPAVDRLAELPRTDLVTTARTTLELGGDVAAAAEVLHIHRTTLYYRLDRIADLTGVDVRTSPDRLDLQLALRLAAYRAAGD
jgi:hypothetical protein